MEVADIKQVFIENEVSLTKNDVWKVQQAWVIKHSALERLGAKLKVSFDDPVMLQGPHQTNWDGLTYAMLVRGRRIIGDKEFVEWSIGEVNSSNYRTTGKQPAYFWAMTEKRSKDRTLIKLVGLQGLYSEDEADEFKDADKKVYPAEASAKQPEVVGQTVSQDANGPVRGAPLPPDKIQPKNKAAEPKKQNSASKSDTPKDLGLTEEQMDIITRVSEAGEIGHVSEIMMSPEVREVLDASDQKDRNMIRHFAQERLKALGWLGSKPEAKKDDGD